MDARFEAPSRRRFPFPSRRRGAVQRRPRPRLATESLEPRQLMHAAPHGGGGMLFDEHEAVMRLVDFATIHQDADAGAYYVARDASPATPNVWSDVANWTVRSFDASTQAFVDAPATHLPATGDDVEIPQGLSFVYDISPAAFNVPVLPGADPATTSVKNNMRLHSVAVEGALSFATNTDVLMVFETMVVAPTGSLSMHVDAAHSARMIIAAPDWRQFSLAAPFDTELDPFQFARGIISHGSVDIQGEDVTPFITLPQLTRAEANIAATKAKAGVPADPGAFRFTVPAGTPTTGWTVGDRILVAGTDPTRFNPATGASADEEAVITGVAVNADGSRTFTAKVQVAVRQSSDLLAPPTSITTVGGLQYDHVLPKDPSGAAYLGADGRPAFGVQIANLSRNINVQSEDPYHVAARGHTMFMHNANVSIAGVGFLGLGRSDKRTVVDDVQFYTKEIIDAVNQAALLKSPDAAILPDSMIGEPIPGTGLNPRGRYAVHLHRAGINEVDGTDPNSPILKAATPASVRDSVVVDSPGWGFVSHTSYVNFDDNVAYNVVGASFVTEVGNEMGRFSGNLAIKGVGANTGEGIESRSVKQDFGFQGDGFWFQGPAVSVTNNVAVSQRHDGFVFFTKALVQNYSWSVPDPADPDGTIVMKSRQGARLTTTMLARVYAADLVARLGGAGLSIDPGAVPILGFRNNTAQSVGTGLETWFHLLGSSLPRTMGSTIEGLKVANVRNGTGAFTPYTNLTTFRDATIVGNPSSPGGTGIGRNTVTANMTYDNATIRGFGTGIAVPVNGTIVVSGGTYQNLRNFEITTANSRTRTVWFRDRLAADGTTVAVPLAFLPLPRPADEAVRLNIDLRTSYDPKDRDLRKMFNPDVVRLGTVWVNSFTLGGVPAGEPRQLYYYEQAAGMKPFPALDANGQPRNYGRPVTDAFGNVIDSSGIEVPPELLDLTNAQLFSNFGLAIGGTVAPAAAVDANPRDAAGRPLAAAVSPRINGLIGPASGYQGALDATSAAYTRAIDTSANGRSSPQYALSYRSTDATTGTVTNVTVRVGNLVNAAGYAVQIKTLRVNGVAVTAPAPVNPPAQPVATDNPTKAVAKKYAQDLAAYNTFWKNYYASPVLLSLRAGWNVITGDFDGTGALRTLLIYGDVAAPDINLTGPDSSQLRRLADPAGTAADPWQPGRWNAAPQKMLGVAVGSTDQTPKVAEVTGQLVAVMHPNDLSFGFSLKGRLVDNSFGSRPFDMFIGNLTSYLNPKDRLPFLTAPSDDAGNPLANYARISDYASFKAGTNATAVVQHLQTMFFAVKDFAGNSKTFALTIFLDSTAPRVGGSANPTGSFNPSASMVALAGQAYVIDAEMFAAISLTDPKKKV